MEKEHYWNTNNAERMFGTSVFVEYFQLGWMTGKEHYLAFLSYLS